MTAEEFKEWRYSLNWTQQQAADALGVSKATVANYEAGRRREDQRPVEIPFSIKMTCVALANAHGTEDAAEFERRLTTTSVKDGLPTEGEAERFRHLEAKAFADEVYERLARSVSRRNSRTS